MGLFLVGHFVVVGERGKGKGERGKRKKGGFPSLIALNSYIALRARVSYPAVP